MYTGNTELIKQLRNSIPVYPCVYREHTPRDVGLIYFNGLSLCIQGTRYHKYNCLSSPRFIPVYTGNTNIGHDPGQHIAVYPCVYREHATDGL